MCHEMLQVSCSIALKKCVQGKDLLYKGLEVGDITEPKLDNQLSLFLTDRMVFVFFLLM